MTYPYNGYYNPYQNFQNQFQNQNQYQQPTGLLGRQIDSIDGVKVASIPFDGSVSYFPLTDGSAILTKQLMQDGTSKIVMYKPVNETKPTYITHEEFNKEIKALREQFLGKETHDEPNTTS